MSLKVEHTHTNKHTATHSCSVLFHLTDHWDSLQYPLSSHIHDGRICDVWNGQALHSQKDFFSYPEHLAFSLSTDGVPLFKSSSTSFWPVYLVIHNQPPKIRMNSSNLIICAVWCVPGTKPPSHPLLEPIVQTMQQLTTIGMEIPTPSGMKVIRGKLLFGVFDMPAKVQMLNMKNFNGKYGCPTCLNPGIHYARAHIYLPDVDAAPRTQRSVITSAEEAERSGDFVQGIKGRSILTRCLDIVDGIPVDYMHAVLEGITKWLLRAWFESSNHREPYYIKHHLKDVDRALLNQCPPHEFSRPPRSITKHMKYFKASELRSWLLFYSLPLLLGRLSPLYFHHYALLVCAIHILLKESITNSFFNRSFSSRRDD